MICATFFIVTGEKKQYNSIYWKLLEGYSIWTDWYICWLKKVFPFYDIKKIEIKTELGF